MADGLMTGTGGLAATVASDTSAVLSVWTMVAVALVLSMQGGFLLLEAGSVRSKNTVNVAQKNVADFLISGTAFFLFGGFVMFGAGTTGLFGWSGFSLENTDTAVLFAYQFAFCATAATLVSGAVAERMRFSVYVALSAVVAGAIYPFVGHWAWGNLLISDNPAFLADLGFLDYAGSSVVHLLGASVALVAVLFIGPRAGRFSESGEVLTIRGHSPVLALQGVIILAVGWIGFNAGAARPGTSELSSIVINTLCAMSLGGLGGILYDAIKRKGRIRSKTSSCGLLGGLVSITAPCAYVDMHSAMLIGFIGGLLSTVAADVILHKLRIDDPVDVLAVHGIAGIWGTMAVSIFGASEVLGMSRLAHLAVQCFGMAVISGYAMLVAYAALRLISRVTPLRVTPAQEELGLNLAEHDDTFDAAPVERFIEQNNLIGARGGLGVELGGDDASQTGADLDRNIGLLGRAVGMADAKTAEVEYLAFHDSLTGLCNRVAFKKSFAAAMEVTNEAGGALALASFDLDGFKSVNDLHGHATGDELLKLVAERFRQFCGNGCLIARFGGDEFVLGKVLPNDRDQDYVASWLNQLVQAMSQPFYVDMSELRIGTSAGVTVFPTQGMDIEQLLSQSDMALYEAKQAGRGTWLGFASRMEEQMLRRRRLEAGLRTACENDDFEIVYQPKFTLNDGTITGFEALLRWKSLEFGEVSPVEFIPIAEECGLIHLIGQMVMEKACIAARAWQGLQVHPCTVAVNVSPIQFFRSDFLDEIRAILERSGLPPSLLEIELTEGALVKDKDIAIGLLSQMREMGISIAVDDFGTGYSSLNYLKNFPVDRLKIDRSFVENLENAASDQRIAEMIVSLGKGLGLTVLAEGVETEAQISLLKEFGCDELQGFLYSRPVSLARVTEMLTHARAGTAAPTQVYGQTA